MDWAFALEELRWGVFRGSETLMVPLWPLVLSLVGVATAATAVRRDGPKLRWWVALALAPFAGWVGAMTLLSDHAHRLEAVWPLAAVGLVGVLAPPSAAAIGRGRAKLPRLAAASALALPLALQLLWLGSADFPFVEVDYAPHQHLGRSQTLTAEVQFADCPLSRSEVVLAGDAPGEHRVAFEAACAGFHVRRTVIVTVGTDEADPRFPLSPGRRWRWVLTPADGGADETVDGELLASRWDDGPLHGLEAVFRHQTVQLYGFEGRTWIFDRRLGPGPDRHFAPVYAALPDSPTSDVDGFEPAEGAAPFVFLPMRWRCERLATPAGGIEGPDDCLASVDRTDPVLGGLALFLTGGLALPAVMRSATAHATLAESSVPP